MSVDRIEIPEVVVPDKRLGRHIRHDPQSLRYAFRAPTIALVSKRWSTESTPVLNQGDIGSCTGNATVGALLCDNGNPIHEALNADQVSSLNEDLAVKIYSAATGIDNAQGTYPPDDTGSDGVSVAKTAQSLGYISGYSHAFSLNDALVALTTAPVILGINWYAGFDNPSSTGLIKKTGEVRGGHEICLDEIDVEGKKVWFRNSWSDSWGVNGRAYMTWDTFSKLLDEQGDVTVFTPLSVGPPTPTPSPEPDVVPTVTDADLYAATTDWIKRRKCYKPNEVLRQVLIQWRKISG